MTEPTYASIARDGLWTNNPGLVQLLGLCPLLAVTSNAVNGLGLGLATALTLVASNVTVSLIRRVVRPEVRIPVFVLVIASVVTVIELAMNAYLHELYLVLGIFIPLIVTNCNIIGRAEAFASKHDPGRALVDGLMMGTGFLLVLVVLGAMRELVGQGTLLSQAHMMFGEAARGWTLHVVEDYRGFLLAILPPGAFIGLGLIIALKNIIDGRLQRRARRVPAAEPAPAAG
ncbi:MAG: electron transport complex subunit E [Gammaproteobacteria bacterium]|nr:electron transport complex subunit E [Gammaproteobacteria bacterium]